MLLKNERGSSLVMVLLVLTVGAMIGLAMLTIGVNEDIQVSAEEKNIQAYYIARSAADALGAYIIELRRSDLENGTHNFNIGNIETLVNNPHASVEMFGGEAEMTMSTSNGEVEIDATSTYDGFSGHAILVLDYISKFEYLIWSRDDIDGEGLEVFSEGSEIASNGDVIDITYKTNQGGFDAIEVPGQTYDPIEPVLPLGLPHKNDMVKNDDYTITESCYIGDFDLGNGKFIIEANLSDVDIVLGNGAITSDIIIGNNTSVNIYLEEGKTLTIQTPITANGSGSSDPGRLHFYLLKDSTFHFLANGDVYAYIDGPNANVDLGSSQTHLYGSIICDNLVTNGNPNLTYVAPSGGDDENYFMKRILWKD